MDRYLNLIKQVSKMRICNKMKNIYKFSIITSTYNSMRFLPKAVDSVLSQTFDDYEYIIVNNGSSDDTAAYLDKMIHETNKNIKVITLEENAGISGGRNTGINEAKGEYICFLDADDLWLPRKLEIINNAIKEYPEIDVFCHWEYFEKEGDRKQIKYRDVDNKDAYLDLLFNGNCLSTSALSVRTTLMKDIGGFDECLISGEEDFDCWLRLAHAGAKFLTVKETMGVWLIRNDSVSAKHISHTEAVLKMLKVHFDLLYNQYGTKEKIIISKYNRICAIQYCGCAHALSKENRRQSNSIYIKAIKYYPLYWKPYAGILLNFLHL